MSCITGCRDGGEVVSQKNRTRCGDGWSTSTTSRKTADAFRLLSYAYIRELD